MHLLLGEYAHSVDSKVFLVQRGGGSNEYVIAQMRGKRMVYSVEPEADARLAESFLKQATGGDRQNGRHPYGRPFSFVPTHTLWLAANHRPVIRGTDDAIWIRIRLIPFNHPIPEAQQIPKHEVLARFHAELPGILAWAVQGAKEWYADGLGKVAAVTKATASYREEMDTLGAWIEDCCVLEPQCWAYTSDLRASYEQWCAANGAQALNETQLGRQLSDRQCPPDKRNGRRTREGIGLRSDASPHPPTPPPATRTTQERLDGVNDVDGLDGLDESVQEVPVRAHVWESFQNPRPTRPNPSTAVKPSTLTTGTLPDSPALTHAHTRAGIDTEGSAKVHTPTDEGSGGKEKPPVDLCTKDLSEGLWTGHNAHAHLREWCVEVLRENWGDGFGAPGWVIEDAAALGVLVTQEVPEEEIAREILAALDQEEE
jgi:hypothetical protein